MYATKNVRKQPENPGIVPETFLERHPDIREHVSGECLGAASPRHCIEYEHALPEYEHAVGIRTCGSGPTEPVYSKTSCVAVSETRASLLSTMILLNVRYGKISSAYFRLACIHCSPYKRRFRGPGGFVRGVKNDTWPKSVHGNWPLWFPMV